MLGRQVLVFLQNIVDSFQPIAIFNSLDMSIEFFGKFDIPNHYNNTEVGAISNELSALIFEHIY